MTGKGSGRYKYSWTEANRSRGYKEGQRQSRERRRETERQADRQSEIRRMRRGGYDERSIFFIEVGSSQPTHHSPNIVFSILILHSLSSSFSSSPIPPPPPSPTLTCFFLLLFNINNRTAGHYH